MSTVVRCRISTLTTKIYFTFTIGGDLSCNIGVQHEQEIQHNHFGGPVADEHEPDKHLEDHVEGDNVNKEVGEVVQANEDLHVVGDDESSADDNFDIFGHDDQHDKSEGESVYESAKEDNAPMNDLTKDPVDYRQRTLMV